jgi:gliding motility-associated-like protein
VNRKSINFYCLLQEAQSAVLDFGDSSPPLNIAGNATGIVSHSVTHVYNSTGDYTVILTGIASTGCLPSKDTLIVKVRDVQAVINATNSICVNDVLTVSAAQSVDVFTVNCGYRNRNYLWSFDFGVPSDTLDDYETHTFTSVGIHSITVRVKDFNGCESIVTKTISVSGPTPTFTFNSNPICLSDGSVQITNSTPQLPDSISNYQWDFGDGQFYTTGNLFVPLHYYTNASVPFSIYNVVLTATNALGCVNSTAHTLQVSRPDASFNLSPQNICMNGVGPVTVTFTALYTYPSYTFDFGTSPSATVATSASVISHPYSPGVYTVGLHVKNIVGGCENTQTVVVNAVQTPTADFVFLSPGSTGGNAICSPATVQFTNTSLPQPYTPAWDLGTGNAVQPLNIVTQSYSTTTTSSISIGLTVTTGPPNFCHSSVTKNFKVYHAKADILLSSAQVCLGDQIRFSIDTAAGGGVRGWVWDYGDASLTSTVFANSGPPSFTMHTYNTYPVATAGSTTVSLIYLSADNACKYFVEKPIQVIKLDADFKRNGEILKTDTVHCFRIPDEFRSVFFAGNPGTLLYDWQFPGGATAGGSITAYTFPQPGSQQVTLTVRDAASNCTASASRNMIVLPLPTATLSTGLFCPERPFPITASLSPGAVSGTWSPVENIVGANTFTTGSGVFTSTGVASVTTKFTLNVTDTSNCVSDPIDTGINIIPPPPKVKWDTTVVIGKLIPINGYIGNFTYTWSPVTANLSCTYCASAVSNSTVNITYSLMVEDLAHCAITTNIYDIIIEPKISVDVPTAFTPNGDGINDVIYVDGWGIKKLIYFRVFNRWGQFLFESNDISVGWDGMYKGAPQNVDTYVYQVSVETWLHEQLLSKTSTFKLLR